MDSGFTGGKTFQIGNAKSVDAESTRPIVCFPDPECRAVAIAAPKEILAFNLKRLRTSAGISQEELADRAGLHRTYISSVERAQRNVSLENIFLIAQALGATPVELLQTIPKDRC